MVGERIVDPQTGRIYEVNWDGSKGSVSLVGNDPRYTRQRPDARDYMTRSATVTLDVRPRSVFFKQEV